MSSLTINSINLRERSHPICTTGQYIPKLRGACTGSQTSTCAGRAHDACPRPLPVMKSFLRTSKFSSIAPRSTTVRHYQSYDHPPPPGPFSNCESHILSKALQHVPSHGFSNITLSLGAKEAGYLDASANLFPSGAFSLVHFYLLTKRLELSKECNNMNAQQPSGRLLTVGEKVKELTWRRLLLNRQIIHHWQEAISLMTTPSNLATSMAELHSLSDEIWFLSGDTSVDTSWYTKRATLSMIYASSELFMTNDVSTGFVDTRSFLDRRFEDSYRLGTTAAGIGQWAGFTLTAGINVLRSKGLRV